VAQQPDWSDARYSLASVYARIDKVREAVTLLESVLADDANHYRANLLLGRILTLTGHADAAAPYLEKAVKVQADSAEANAFLADAYDKLGHSAEAAAARARATALRRKPQ
jgi:predicted Zn-dependent protease